MNALSKSDVKYIQSLAHKKYRDQDGVFIVEGVKMVEELISHFPERIVRIFATKNWFEQHGQFVKKITNLVLLEQFELEKISFLKTPNDVVALVSMEQLVDLKEFSSGITVVLDKLQDPGNLGTIIRSCDWFGIKNIVCSQDTVDAFSPKVVQASMGSIMRLNVIYKNLSDFFSQYKHLPIYSAELAGESVFEVDFIKPSILIIGNESKGVSPEITSFATKHIMIPRIGMAESLNAAVASSIILSCMTR
jgi:TrmH family RNA methyltransferase